MYKISDNGISFIIASEGEVLTAYKDSAGIWTIGVGHIEGVKKGDVITHEQSRAFLLSDLRKSEAAVNDLVKVELNQNQYDALVSFTFNLGRGALGSSTLLKLINKRQFLSAAGQFAAWNKATDPRTKKKVVVEGLSKRRAREEKLFLS